MNHSGLEVASHSWGCKVGQARRRILVMDPGVTYDSLLQIKKCAAESIVCGYYNSAMYVILSDAICYCTVSDGLSEHSAVQSQ